MQSFTEDSIGIISFPSLEEKYGIGVYFTSRRGGISNGFHEGLNLSFNVGDKRDSVLWNREIVSKVVGAELDRWILCRQVHGCRIRKTNRYDRGRGAHDYESAIPRTDALISTQSGTLIGALSADCVPVVIVNGRKRICAVAHAGWRGVLAGVVPLTCREIRSESGEEPQNIEVFIGPHIRSCCFKVKEDTKNSFESEIGSTAVASGSDQGEFIDLEAALIYQLVNEGIDRSNIHCLEKCTACDDNYFSHRKDMGLTGRQAGFAVIY